MSLKHRHVAGFTVTFKRKLEFYFDVKLLTILLPTRRMATSSIYFFVLELLATAVPVAAVEVFASK